ncbi:MAG: glycosyltransferase family 2 protein [Eubacteriales bacterium]|nr:glycosyltransferase family 2 protein [Eubacteriales bacterium]
MDGQKTENRTLSIILPVFNGEKTVRRSIESVLRAKKVPLELVIVDDGSTDRTGEICRQYAKACSCVRFFGQENRGPGAARNAGLRRVSGAYVGFMDADDCYVPEALERAWEILNEKRADAVCVGIRTFLQSEFPDGKGTVLYEGDDSLISGREAFRRMLGGEGLDSNTYAKFYRRDMLPDDLHFFEGRLGDEIPVTYRMLLSAERVWLMKGTGYLYCIDESGTSLSGVRFAPCYFEMADRAKELYELVCGQYPDFREEAAGFYLDLALQCVERIAGQEEIRPYEEGLVRLLKELGKHREELKRTPHIGRERKRWLAFFLLSCRAAKNRDDRK